MFEKAIVENGRKKLSDLGSMEIQLDVARGFNNQIGCTQPRYLYKEITRGFLYLARLRTA